MKNHLAVALAAAALGIAPAAFAQGVGPEPAAALLAIANLPATDHHALVVTTPAFKDGADIPFENTQYRGNIFPGLSWTAGPRATRSYVVILQDDDGMRNGAAILHWTMYDVPGGMTTLSPGMTAPPAGASFGPSGRGPNRPYAGPHTPPGPAHHYHFQLFALDEVLSPAPMPDYATLIGAMKGHVLASGQIVGLGRVDPTAPPPAAPPSPPVAH